VTVITGKKYIWRQKEVDGSQVKTVASRHNLSFPVAHALCSRGFVSRDEIDSFLFPTLDKKSFHASNMKGALEAVDRIRSAIKKKEKILIFGDYDVDGIASTSLLLVALLPLGADINYYLPHRQKEGYGLSVSVVEKAAKNGYSLIITVDNGISAHEPARRAKALGIDLIVTDHHRPHGTLPAAFAIVDPNQDECGYPYKKLAGVGVTFKIVDLLYEQEKKTLPEKVYELLMLGTVADVVPLTEENRFWVRHGLVRVNKHKSLAVSVLAQNSNLVKKRWGSLDIGFMIAPQINALGRLDDSRDAVKFLISASSEDVVRIGKILKEMNDERKKVERKIYDEIEGVILNKVIDLDRENVIVAASESWPSGVIGLVAGRLMNNYGRPTFLFHEKKDGTLRGSCRSIPEFDIFNALEENKDLLISFGGHSFAAGLCLKKDLAMEFKKRLEDKIAAELLPEALQPKIDLDGECSLPDMTTKLLSDLESLEPFGNGNARPTFMYKNVSLLGAPKLLKEKHLKCSIFADGVVKPVIFFNRPDLFPFFNTIGDKEFSIAGHVVSNEWNDMVRIEVQGLDVALNSKSADF
jgi:single-stranded-DNA-specific exonuclease